MALQHALYLLQSAEEGRKAPRQLSHALSVSVSVSLSLSFFLVGRIYHKRHAHGVLDLITQRPFPGALSRGERPVSLRASSTLVQRICPFAL